MKIAFNPSTVAALTAPPNNKDITFDLRGRNIFARGVKFQGTDTNTWRSIQVNGISIGTNTLNIVGATTSTKDGITSIITKDTWRQIKINNVSIGTNILDLRNGSNTTLTNSNGVVTINSTWRPVVDNLTSDSTTSSLSAKQGKVLKGLLDGKSNTGHTHDDRYLRLSGGTMNSDALITFADSGSWGTDKGPQGARGGLRWTGQSDSIKLYAEETAADNLDLVIQFGDDNSNGLSIRNKVNTQTSYISASGVITTGTFKGNLDWSYITNKPATATRWPSWEEVTDKPGTFTPAVHTHGLSNSVFFLNMPNISGNAKWKEALGYPVNSNLLLSVRINSPAPDWCVGNYGSGILYGGSDTKGFMSSAYNEPFIMWAGGNGSSEDSIPKWYIGIKGTHKSIYNLTTIALEANTAYNLRHSHSNKSVLDGITSALVNSWNTAYNFVNNITKADTDKVINKWDEIVNFLAGIDSNNKLNTLLNSKLSIQQLAANDILTTKTNNALFWVNTVGTAGNIPTGPFTDHPYALLSVTNYNQNDTNGKFFYRSRLAFSSIGDIKVASCHHQNEYKQDETWYNVLTSKNSGISGSTIKLNGTSITVYSSGTADNRYVKKSGDTMTGALNFANGTWNLVGDDSYMGDCNVSGHFGIKAANTTYPGISFFNNANAYLGSLTAYSGNIKYGAYSLQFLDNGNTSVGTSTWTNPFSAYDKNAVKDGQAICVWGQSSHLSNLATDSGDMSLWLKRVNANAATLNMVLDGEYYANGNQRLAHISEIPSSLKNPHALTISLNGTSQGPYDGSAAKSINITPGSIGAATSGHNHDGRYVYNYGGTKMDGSSRNKNALGMSTTSGISEDWWHILQAAWNDEYRWNSQIAFPTQNRNGMYYRSGLDDNTKWGAWVKLLDTGNSSISGNTITINGSSLTVSKSDHNHDYLVVNEADEKSFNSAYHNFQVLYAGGGNEITGRPDNVDAFGLIRLRAAWGGSGQMLLANGGSLYIRSSADAQMTNTLAWRTILDSSNYSSILDSRYYTESEIDTKLAKKLDRVKLTTGSWNPRSYNLAADYHYNGGDLSISETGGQIHVSVDGKFWQNEGQYRVLDTSDITSIRGGLTLYQYLSSTDNNWFPLVWGGSDHKNTNNSTGSLYKSHDKLSWQTSSQTLYATNIRTENIKNLSIGGGIYWNPYVESATDGSDAASITVVKAGVAGGTTLVLSQQNDSNDTIQFKTNTAARLYHNSNQILTSGDTKVSSGKGYINNTEITQVNNSDTLDGWHKDNIQWTGYITSPNSLTSYWFKMYDITVTGYQYNDITITFLVSEGYSSNFSIFYLKIRQNGTNNSENYNLWVSLKELVGNLRDKVVAYYNNSTGNVQLWGNTENQWATMNYTIIKKTTRTATDSSSLGTLTAQSFSSVQTPPSTGYTKLTMSRVGSVSYSDSTGSVHWNNVTNKPSTFNPAAHTHTWASITDKIVAGNEFNIVNAGFKESMWFNYLPINDRSKTAAVASYIMGNGAKGYASVQASGFIKNGGNESQLLRADGGVSTFNWSGQSGQPSWLWGGNNQHSYYVYNPSNFRVAYAASAGNADTVDGKHASDFASAGHTHDGRYLKLSGGTLTGGIEIQGTISGSNYASSEGFYTNEHNSLILRGDATYGKSGILFTSSKGTNSINQTSDKGFIQFQSYGGTNTTGEENKLVIGVGNDSTDMVYIQTPSVTGLKHVVGTNPYTIWDSGNLTKLSQLTNDKGFVTGSVNGKTITINGTSTTWSNTWRPISDDYEKGDASTSLSTLGSLTLYNDLLSAIPTIPTIPNPTNYYWANIKVSSSSSTTTSPTVNVLTATRVCAGHDPGISNSISCSNWFRSSGETGWYSSTYGGGWYMSDKDWIRSWGSKALYINNSIRSTNYQVMYGSTSASAARLESTTTLVYGTDTSSNSINSYLRGTTVTLQVKKGTSINHNALQLTADYIYCNNYCDMKQGAVVSGGNFTVNNNSYLAQSAGAKVGIGTSSLSDSLSVNGSMNVKLTNVNWDKACTDKSLVIRKTTLDPSKVNSYEYVSKVLTFQFGDGTHSNNRGTCTVSVPAGYKIQMDVYDLKTTHNRPIANIQVSGTNTLQMTLGGGYYISGTDSANVSYFLVPDAPLDFPKTTVPQLLIADSTIQFQNSDKLLALTNKGVYINGAVNLQINGYHKQPIFIASAIYNKSSWNTIECRANAALITCNTPIADCTVNDFIVQYSGVTVTSVRIENFKFVCVLGDTNGSYYGVQIYYMPH